MSVDAELDSWRKEWQSETTVLPDLTAKVRRQSRFMRIMLGADVLVTVVIGGYTTVWAARSLQPDVIVLAAATWVFLFAAWAFAINNRRNCWAPAALTTSAFVDISIRRCRASIAAVKFGVILYFCEIVFCLAWIYRHILQRSSLSLWAFLTSGTVIAVWFCTLAFIGFVVWYRRRKQAELAYLLSLAGIH